MKEKLHLGGCKPEFASEAGGTMMGRLASRMHARDFIDEQLLGNKGKSVKAKKAMIADNSEDGIPKKMHISNMADQAKASGNVYNLKASEIPDNQFNAEALQEGIKVEKEHTDDPNIAKAIAKAHLLESKDYYTKLKEREKTF